MTYGIKLKLTRRQIKISLSSMLGHWKQVEVVWERTVSKEADGIKGKLNERKGYFENDTLLLF